MESTLEALSSEAHRLEDQMWLNHELFSFNWWVIVIFNAALFILLLVLADKKRVLQIALAFLIAYSIVGFFDEIGVYYLWWSYPYELIPFSTRFNAVDFFAIPCIIAFMYQWFSRWTSFLVATVIYSLLNSYVGEPVFVLLGIYKLNAWTYTRSFLVMLLIPPVVKLIADLVARNKTRTNHNREISVNWFGSKAK